MVDPSKPSSARGHAVAVSGVMLVIFLFAIDGTVVSTAMPTIVGKLGGLELYSWVFSAYMLSSALSTPLFGNLSDLYGRRRLMLIGIGLFTLGSVLCGAAQTIEQLVLSRAIQGVGGGAIYALSFILIGFLYPPEERARMQALISGLWGIASILGPLAGAVIAQYWSWRWIFFINLPICLMAALLIGFGVSEIQTERRRRLDLKGAATLLIGLSLLFYALEEGRRNGFALDWPLAVLLVSAVAALALLYRIERRAEEPILPPALFRLRLFRICVGSTWLSSMGMFGVIGYLPLYIQGALNGGPSQASLTLVLASLGWTAGSFVAGPAIRRFDYRATAVAGMVLMALGYGAFAGAGYQLGLFMVLAVGTVIGVGMGIVSVTCIVAAQNGAPLNQLGVATSTVMVSRMLGGAFGISLMGSVLVAQMQRRLMGLSAELTAGASSGLIQKLANPESLLEPSLRASIPEPMVAALVEILARSVWSAFLAGLFVMLLGVALSFFLSAGSPVGSMEPGDKNKSPRS